MFKQSLHYFLFYNLQLKDKQILAEILWYRSRSTSTCENGTLEVTRGEEKLITFNRTKLQPFTDKDLLLGSRILLAFILDTPQRDGFTGLK